jgi:hypothetical protein
MLAGIDKIGRVDGAIELIRRSERLALAINLDPRRARSRAAIRRVRRPWRWCAR